MADKKAMLLRIPADLWSALSRWARDDLRSVNAQIEWLLREAVRRRAGGRGTAPLSAPAESGLDESGDDSNGYDSGDADSGAATMSDPPADGRESAPPTL